MTRHPDQRARRMKLAAGAFLAIFVWLILGGVGGQSIGKLSQLQKNDTASFLPESAESTQVAKAITAFQSDTTLPLIVVGARDSGLTPADLQTAQTFATTIVADRADLCCDQTIGNYLASPQVPVLPSQDGKAFLVVLQLNAEAIRTVNGEDIPLNAIASAVQTQVVDQLRSTGLTAYVTGPGGFIADLTKAFGGIDGVLLLVTLGVVLIILLIVYRSPVLPFAVLLTAVFGLSAAGLVVYLVADAGWITVSGQSQGILSILVVGAATDYSLLLVSRYKEELHDQESTWAALRTAWRATIEPIMASAATVILGLLALLLADLKGTSGLGPVGALGIVGAFLAATTFLPAILLIGRRWIFWPSIPRVDHLHTGDKLSARFGWHKVAGMVGNHPRRTWVLTTLALLVASAFLPTFKASGISQGDLFLTKVDSVEGQKLLAEHFDAGSGSPLQVIAPAASQTQVLDHLGRESGISDPYAGVAPGAPATPVDGKVLIQATLVAAADSPEATDTVQRVRADLHAIDPAILVGGATAQQLDTKLAADRDLKVVVPMIILVVFLVLVLLLRSLVAPALLILVNLLSFGATMGISAIVFNHIAGFPGGDPTTVLYGFVFLVALGVDYSIFLMTRAREESVHRGAKAGMLKALTVTGGVITSAGIVLASTFGALAVIPLVFLAQIAFIVAFGVLIDTLVVRSLLVPAVSVDLGPRTWWPSALSRGD